MENITGSWNENTINCEDLTNNGLYMIFIGYVLPFLSPKVRNYGKEILCSLKNAGKVAGNLVSLTEYGFEKVQGLKNNNEPYEDFGIEQTWEFAHPNNKKYTGPLEKFKSMLKSDMYEMLINHIENKIDIISASENSATYRVTVLDDKKKYYQFEWVVKKYDKSGPLKNCWLTSGVSQPMPLGSSI